MEQQLQVILYEDNKDLHYKMSSDSCMTKKDISFEK